MLVSHLKKFIFIKTVKTASTSTEVLLQPYCVDPSTYKTWSEVEEWQKSPIVSEFGVVGARGPEVNFQTDYYNHMPASEVRSKVGAEIWSNYFKVANIRNPWEKTISHFFFAGIDRKVDLKKIELVDLRRMASEFVLEYRIQPVERFFRVPDNQMDFYIRHERYETDIQFVCLKLGIEKPISTPKLKTGYWPKNFPEYRDLYTPEAKDHIGDIYAGWIRNFNYKF